MGGTRAQAFAPAPLPPEPPLRLEGPLRSELDAALLALGRLDGVTTLLPDSRLFLGSYVRKEALLSSQIEGTRFSLSDQLLFELGEVPGVPRDDVEEVSSYVAALQHGLRRIREGFPLSNRLIREIHQALLSSGRGAEKEPGRFRRSPAWLGGRSPGEAIFVAPPWKEVEPCMAAPERFLHAKGVPGGVLVKAALAHAWFETMRPFLDGSGRVGRLLATLLLCSEGALREPLLDLPLYLKAHRGRYDELLQQTRFRGDWAEWISFFVRGMTQPAESAVGAAQERVALFEAERRTLQDGIRAAGSALQAHAALQGRPVLSNPRAAEHTGLSAPTVAKALGELMRLGIVRELTGKRRGRLYGDHAYLAQLAAGTEPLEA